MLAYGGPLSHHVFRLALALLPACSSLPPTPSGNVDAAPGPTNPAAEAAAPEPCGMAFDPAPELADATRAAAERWSVATGCDVRVEAGGIAVSLVDSIVRPDGSQAPGWTSDERDRVEINVRCGATQ